MPRPHRPQVPGGIYHVTSRGNRRQSIYADDHDRQKFLAFLADAVRRYRWHCHAYCLMENHFHLVVETPEPNISLGMHRLNSRYARWFNWRHALDGHLFQDRFYSTLVETDWHLLELSRYIALNPPRAGVCLSAADWRWSSYRATIGLTRRPTFLTIERILRQFGRERLAARQAYATFVREGLLVQTE
jgi:putative transposase